MKLAVTAGNFSHSPEDKSNTHLKIRVLSVAVHNVIFANIICIYFLFGTQRLSAMQSFIFGANYAINKRQYTVFHELSSQILNAHTLKVHCVVFRFIGFIG